MLAKAMEELADKLKTTMAGPEIEEEVRDDFHLV